MTIRTPRGEFRIVEETKQELEAQGFDYYFTYNGFIIMSNGKKAVATAA